MIPLEWFCEGRKGTWKINVQRDGEEISRESRQGKTKNWNQQIKNEGGFKCTKCYEIDGSITVKFREQRVL